MIDLAVKLDRLHCHVFLELIIEMVYDSLPHPRWGFKTK